MHDIFIRGDLLVDIACDDDLVEADACEGHEDDEF